MYACRLRDAGVSAAGIAEALDQKKKDVRVLALLDTLEYLKRGGRISKTAALAGNLLSIKPVITIADGGGCSSWKSSRLKKRLQYAPGGNCKMQWY